MHDDTRDDVLIGLVERLQLLKAVVYNCVGPVRHLSFSGVGVIGRRLSELWLSGFAFTPSNTACRRSRVVQSLSVGLIEV